MSEYNTLLTRYENASAANQHLHVEMSQLQQEKKSLKMERDHLNQTLEVIFQFSVFPVDDYCPVTDHAAQDRKCSGHCQKGWVYYQSSCYLFLYYQSYLNWKNWAEGDADCTARGSHLVTIDTADEQAFINNHTKYYYDEWHGYFIGLSNIQDKWQWVNGSELKGGYWTTGRPIIQYGSCVASMPSTDPMKSWKNVECYMKNRWICEMEAAIWPN
ncbi:C-type lectin domain family 4 member E-like isoform X2 [Sardina pilchardus]|uniref:C-type lectin domain family 4 member E-like isoform X2 n=1 Tax=Sardina pilchardus TaxID=27697 RepID=UPI002E11AED5